MKLMYTDLNDGKFFSNLSEPVSVHLGFGLIRVFGLALVLGQFLFWPQSSDTRPHLLI